jgi:DNA gyrase subunit A
MAETIVPASLNEETRKRYLTYALSVITSRALPDVRDGLKPVQRRILYTMYHDLGLRFAERAKKCATIVGAVLGSYHPHGDTAAYDALVRMAQGWVLRVPLVHGQGNFGSVDGDEPAAYRYTEAKLTTVSERLMAELRQRVVGMRPNFDNSREEPVVLPAQFPHLLVNGSQGIAVGLATNIPPHNLREVVNACVLLIDNPGATTANLLDKVKGPDFPLGGKVVTDRATLREIYETGSGGIKVQGEWAEENVGSRYQIVVTSIPYGVDKGKLEQEIGTLIAERKLPQLLNLVNESNEKEGLRIVLEARKGTDPNLVMAYLYKHTALQQNFSYNMTCLVPTFGPGGREGTPRPERLGLKGILLHFLDFRFATVRRRFEFELEQLRRRIHILEAFRVIFDGLDRALKLIRESNGRADAADKLMKAFKLDQIQADAVVDAQLYKIAQLEIRKILDELQEKKGEAARIEALLKSKAKLWNVVKTELLEVAEKHGDRRRTKIGSADDAPDFDPEAYIVRENTNVVLTRDGWIKRVGRLASVEGTRVREGDEVLAVVPGSTLDHVIFLADDGTAYTMRINEVPASSGYGEPLAKFFRLGDGVRVVGLGSTDERFLPADRTTRKGEPDGPFLLVATAQGQTLRTPLTAYRTASTKAGRRYVRLSEGDKVVLATVLTEQTSLFLASASGHVIHFPIDEVNVIVGAGKGVIGIKLEEGDVCLGGQAMSRTRGEAFVVETSAGKRMEFTGLKETVGRGGKGFEAVKRTSLVRVVPPPISLVDWDKVEGKDDRKKAETNGHADQKTLFE